jgi:hypothetical protein
MQAGGAGGADSHFPRGQGCSLAHVVCLPIFGGGGPCHERLFRRALLDVSGCNFLSAKARVLRICGECSELTGLANLFRNVGMIHQLRSPIRQVLCRHVQPNEVVRLSMASNGGDALARSAPEEIIDEHLRAGGEMLGATTLLNATGAASAFHHHIGHNAPDRSIRSLLDGRGSVDRRVSRIGRPRWGGIKDAFEPAEDHYLPTAKERNLVERSGSARAPCPHAEVYRRCDLRRECLRVPGDFYQRFMIGASLRVAVS